MGWMDGLLLMPYFARRKLLRNSRVEKRRDMEMSPSNIVIWRRAMAVLNTFYK